MLKKLLRYDIAAIKKFFWIGVTVSLSASIVGALLLRFFIYASEVEENVALMLLSLVAFLISIVAVIAVFFSFAFTAILVFVRFYRHFFTDEGYLTFTLPVKRSTLLLSKTLSAVILLSAHFLVTALSIFLYILLAAPIATGGGLIDLSLFTALGELFSALWLQCGGWLPVFLLEALLAIFLLLCFSILLVQLCITFSTLIFKKAKLALSLLFYYGVSSVVSLVGQFGFALFGGILSESVSILLQEASGNRIFSAYALLALVMLAVLATVSLLVYSLTQYLIDRKLNLA